MGRDGIYLIFFTCRERGGPFFHLVPLLLFCFVLFLLLISFPLTANLIIPCQVWLKFTEKFKSIYKTLIDVLTRLSKQLKKMRLKLKIIISGIDKKERGWKALVGIIKAPGVETVRK